MALFERGHRPFRGRITMMNLLTATVLDHRRGGPSPAAEELA